MMDIEKPAKENWVEALPQHSQNVLQASICSNGLIITGYLQDAQERVEVHTLNGSSHTVDYLRDIKLPEIGSLAGISSSWDSDELFYSFNSFTDPGSSYRVNMTTFETILIQRTKVSASIPDSSQFVTDQVWYKSKDGTEVPMFIVRKKSVLPSLDSRPAKPVPTLLYGYGGFGISITPFFSVSRLIFLHNLDGIFAVAGIRGGGEYGEDWHKASVKEKKQTGFDDFMAAAEYLQQKRYTDNKNLIIQGGSNGGLLVTACANQRPDLFAAVIAQVPVTDMLRFHKFTIGYAWTSEYGNSDMGGYDYQIKYSPLHTVKEQLYPAMMVTTADHDDRVVPLHTYKYVATLQYVAGKVPGQRPLLARIDHKAGHGGGKPMSKVIDEVADEYGFIAEAIQAEWKESQAKEEI